MQLVLGGGWCCGGVLLSGLEVGVDELEVGSPENEREIGVVSMAVLGVVVAPEVVAAFGDETGAGPVVGW